MISAGLLQNGLWFDSTLPQVLEPQQHGEHPFELAVEMDLVAAKPFQFVGVEGFAERLLADQWPVYQFFPPRLEPRQHFAFD
jgi:hypothetical protein